jgi:hypothetical protein
MQHDPDFIRLLDARTVAAVHDAARLRARELRAQAVDAFWSALLRRVRERLRTERRTTARASTRHDPCVS